MLGSGGELGSKAGTVVMRVAWVDGKHLPLSASLGPALSVSSPETSAFCGAMLCSDAQSWLTLCDPVVCGLQGSSIHGDSPGKNT